MLCTHLVLQACYTPPKFVLLSFSKISRECHTHGHNVFIKRITAPNAVVSRVTYPARNLFKMDSARQMVNSNVVAFEVKLLLFGQLNISV